MENQQDKQITSGENFKEVLVLYHGEKFRVVLGPPCFVEQANGALMGTGTPSINLVEPETGLPCYGLTFDIPKAPLRPGQVLVGGQEEDLRVLMETGVVRFTGEYYHSKRFNASFAVCDLLATATVGHGGWVDLPQPIIVRAGEAFIAMPMLIRLEIAQDHEAVRQVNRLAFGQDAAARLVDALRASGFARVSLVADIDGQVVVMTVHASKSSLPLGSIS